MRLNKGFRIPEPSDQAIQWPAEKSQRPDLAVWEQQTRSWRVVGIERCFGSPLELVQQFGNDWYPVSIVHVPTELKP